MNVVIFNDKSEDVVSFRRTLGPYRLAQSLKDNGYTVQVVEWLSSWSRADLSKLLDHLVTKDCLWVGFSSTFMVSNRKQSSQRAQMYSMPLESIDWLFDNIKSRNPNTQLVYGGAYSHLFSYDDRIDTYIGGYADISVIEYTKGLVNGVRPRFVDSRQYPDPDVNCLKTDWTDPSICLLPNEAVPIELARGCVFKCKFCNYPLIGKRKGTYQRPVDQVREQMIGAWSVTGCTRFYFTDDTFNDDRERLQELHTMFKTLPFKPEFSCFLRLDLIYRWPETADQLLEMGLTGCFFGVETFNKQSAVCVGKGLDPKKTKAELIRLRNLWGDRVMISVGLILGLPYDTPEYFLELEKWIVDPTCPAHNLSLNTLWIGPPAPKGAGQKDGFSDFNLNIDVYGYDRGESGSWKLKSQRLTKEICDYWKEKFYRLTTNRNRIAEFYVQDYQNLGITLDEIHSNTANQIHSSKNLSQMLLLRQQEYQKALLGFLGIV